MTQKIKEGPLEEKWRSHTGTGITANKESDALALRESMGGSKEFAIVKLYGGCWTTSPMEVLEELKSSNLEEAKKRFADLAKELGFKIQPERSMSLLFS